MTKLADIKTGDTVWRATGGSYSPILVEEQVVIRRGGKFVVTPPGMKVTIRKMPPTAMSVDRAPGVYLTLREALEAAVKVADRDVSHATGTLERATRQRDTLKARLEAL